MVKIDIFSLFGTSGMLKHKSQTPNTSYFKIQCPKIIKTWTT